MSDKISVSKVNEIAKKEIRQRTWFALGDETKGFSKGEIQTIVAKVGKRTVNISSNNFIE